MFTFGDGNIPCSYSTSAGSQPGVLIGGVCWAYGTGPASDLTPPSVPVSSTASSASVSLVVPTLSPLIPNTVSPLPSLPSTISPAAPSSNILMWVVIMAIFGAAILGIFFYKR